MKEVEKEEEMRKEEEEKKGNDTVVSGNGWATTAMNILSTFY